MRVVCFDVDDTLKIGPYPGPIDIRDLEYLRNQGNIIGIAGNFFIAFKHWPDWYKVCSFFGPLDGNKPGFLSRIKQTVGTMPIEEFVMVGNMYGDPGVLPTSNDDGAARLSGFRFIKESDFASGKR